MFEYNCPLSHTNHLMAHRLLLKLETWNLKLETWNLKLETWNLKLETCNLKLETWNLKFETWNLKLETWNLKLELNHEPNLHRLYTKRVTNNRKSKSGIKKQKMWTKTKIEKTETISGAPYSWSKNVIFKQIVWPHIKICK